jgi:hypothetical protein
MTGQPPPSRDRDLGFDEFIAILVAFAAIGSILFWGLTRRDAGFQLGDLIPRLAASPRTTVLPPRPEADRLSPSPVVRTTPSPFLFETSPTPRAVQPGVATPGVPGVAPVPVPVVVAPSPTGEPVEFTDVSSDYWAYPFIADLSQRGVITGFEDGTFRPEELVNRAQYAAFIQNVLSARFWARPAINDAVQAGFLRGYPEGNFAPNDPISKVQVLASLTNGVQLPEVNNPEQAVARYEDSDQIPDWATSVVASATESSVVVNHPNPNQLAPNDAVTRAEVAAMLYQALEAIGQVDPIESEFVVRP